MRNRYFYVFSAVISLSFLMSSSVFAARTGSLEVMGNITLGTSGASIEISTGKFFGNGSQLTNISISDGSVITGPVVRGTKTVALTDAATIATNASLGNVFTVSSAVDRILGIPTNPTNGQKCIWRWTNSAGVSRSLTLTTTGGGCFRFGSTISYTTATAAGKTDYIGAIYNLTDNVWDVIAYSKGY